MDSIRPWLSKVVLCLSVLSQDKPMNIFEVKQATGINRNVVSAILNACANFGLVDVSFDGRSERFSLTFTAVMYLKILKEEFEPVIQTIQEILILARRFAPKEEIDPESHFLGIIRKDSARPLPAYFKLQTIADAFSLAGNRYTGDSIEAQIFSELALLTKEGSGIFSSSKNERSVGTKLLKRVINSLKSLQKSGIVARRQGFDRVPLRLRKIGVDKGGKKIYQVK